MLWLYQRTMFGKLDKPENQALSDLNFREVLTLAPLVVLAFWIGIFPETFLGMLRPSVSRIVQQMSENAPRTARLQPAGASTQAAGGAATTLTSKPNPPELTNE